MEAFSSVQDLQDNFKQLIRLNGRDAVQGAVMFKEFGRIAESISDYLLSEVKVNGGGSFKNPQGSVCRRNDIY